MWDPGHAHGCHWRRGVAQRECACKQAASGEASGTKRLACGDAFQILQIQRVLYTPRSSRDDAVRETRDTEACGVAPG